MTGRPRILIVDADAAERTAAADALCAVNYEVLLADSVAQAWQLVGAQRPRLVLLARALPDGDGGELLRRIKADAELAPTAVILLTKAASDAPVQLDAGETSADGYIVRPIAAPQLVGRVRTQLRQCELADQLRASEQRFRDLIHSQADAVLVVDSLGAIRFANRAAATLFGVDAERLLAAPFGFPIEGQDPVEIDVVRAGMVAALEMHVAPTRWDGETAWIASLRDISERKRVEANLAAAQRMAHLGSWEFDIRSGQRFWSDETFRIFGLAPRRTAVSNTEFIECVHPEDREQVEALRALALRGDAEFEIEHRIVRPDGEVRWVHGHGELTRDALGQPLALTGTMLDVTDRRHAEATRQELLAESMLRQRELEQANERLTRSQALLRMASQITRIGAWSVELPGLALTCSDEVREILGVPDGVTSTVDEALEFWAPEHRPRIRAAFDACAREGTPYDLELEIISGRGRRLWTRAIGEAVRDSAGAVVRVQGAFQDITAQRESAAQLRLLETAVSRLNDVVMITEAAPLDEPGPRIVFVNEAFVRLTGYTREEVIGRSPRLLQGERTDRAALDRLRSALEHWQPVRCELINYARDGREVRLDIDIVPIADDAGRYTHWVSVERDVTERHEIDERLRQSQRLESIGQLTGGVAHDFNNLLTVILGNAEQLVEELQVTPPRAALAQMIAGAAQRGAELTQRLLAFARKQALDPKIVGINKLITDMDGLLRRTLGEHIEIELVRGGSLWPALVDPGQLESALLNLCINARDAMPRGGRLTIETGNVRLEDEYVARHAELSAGEYVMLAVSDTGIGIPAELVARVFEPFFTTKPMGRGTGLGLAMVYGFAKQSAGHVTLYSESGEGTTVKLYLPRVPATATATAQTHDRAPVAMVEGGGEIILLVEDDELVRRFAGNLLRALGYQVIEAPNGQEALTILRARADVDLLFTDVVMPGGLSGRALADQARAIHPGLGVLFTSGYTENAIVHHGRLDVGVLLLSKPYRRADLARLVRRALDARYEGSR